MIIASGLRGFSQTISHGRQSVMGMPQPPGVNRATELHAPVRNRGPAWCRGCQGGRVMLTVVSGQAMLGVAEDVQQRVRSFLFSSLRGANASRYHQALAMFDHELKMRCATLWDLSDEMLDYALADHLLDLHEAAGDSSGLGHAGTLVAAVAKAKPPAHLKVAWRVLGAWRMRVPPCQAPTVPHELA